MPKPQMTRFSALDVKGSPTNKDNGLYAPQLTQVQIDTIPLSTLKNGAIVYNTDEKVLQTYQDGAWIIGIGNVVGPNVSVDGNIAVFDGTTGAVIRDSGVDIDNVTPSLLGNAITSNRIGDPIVGNRISNLTYIQFVDSHTQQPAIYVGSFSPVNFIANNFGDNDQISSVFTGNIPLASSSVSALLEIQSKTGALLVSRMTTIERNALIAPKDGMILYNTDGGEFNLRQGSNWATLFVTPAFPDSTYILKTPDTNLPNSQALSALGNGILQNTTGTGILSIATQILDTYNATVGIGKNNLFVSINAGNSSTTGQFNCGLGAGSLDALTNGSNNSAFGYGSLSALIGGGNNSAFGYFSLARLTSGGNNSAFGYFSLARLTSGGNNSAFGYGSLTRLTTGSNNSSFGYISLGALTSGNNNSAFGYNSLGALTSGSNNLSFGYNSLGALTSGSNNSAFGYNSLDALTSGDSNSAFGNNSSSNLTTGSDNTAFGYLTGNDNISDNQCTSIGTYATMSGSNTTAIGCNAIAVSNSLVLGGVSVNTPNVGIGTTVPLSTLHVVGTTRVAGTSNVNSDFIIQQFYGQVTNGSITLGTIDFSATNNIYYNIYWIARDNSTNDIAMIRVYMLSGVEGLIGPTTSVFRSSGFTNTAPFTITTKRLLGRNTVTFLGVSNGASSTTHALTVQYFSI